MKIVIRKCPDAKKMLLVLEAVKNGLSYRKASTQYKIPFSTIFTHIKRPLAQRSGKLHLLTREEEKIIIDWVEKCKRRGFPKRKSEIIQGAHSLLKKRNGDINIKCPGNTWFYAFKRRNKLVYRKPESISRPSACITKSNILSWFNIVYKFLSGDDIVGDVDYRQVIEDPARCYNADESFFLLNPSNGPVVVAKGSKNVYEIKNGCEKEGVTVMGCFSADGQKVKQQCIFGYERIPSILKSNFPSSMHLSCSKSGWMNSDLFIEFITEVFHPHVLRKHGPYVPVILFVDGHSSHLSLEVCLLCDSLDIILVQLYPNSTFLIQPADVSCFKSLKSIWRKVINDFRGNDVTKVVTKAAFGKLMEDSFSQLTSETIVNGFRASGIFPWNPENIDFAKCLGEDYVLPNPVAPIMNPITVEEIIPIDHSNISQIIGEDVMHILTSDPFSEQLTKTQAINALLSLINHISGKTCVDSLPSDLSRHENLELNDEINDELNDSEPLFNYIESNYENLYEPRTFSDIMNACHAEPSSHDDPCIDDYYNYEPSHDELCNDDPCNDDPCNDDPCINEPSHDDLCNDDTLSSFLCNDDPCINEPSHDDLCNDNTLSSFPCVSSLSCSSSSPCISSDVSRYDGALPEPPTTSRKNKRNLKFKPHFVLTSKVELVRRQKLQEEKEAERVAKQERALLRQDNKKKKAQEILLNGKKRAENALKKAEAAAAKLQHQSVVAAEKDRVQKIKAAAKLLKIGRIKREKH